MSLLLDKNGAEIPESELPSAAPCPVCARSVSSREVQRGFGRKWKLICNYCGHLFAEGEGEPPVEVCGG